MVRATSVARRRRRRMWSSRRVWSDVCLVCGGIRKTGSLYVLHAPEALKAESLAPYARIYTYASVRIQGIHARARVCVCMCATATRMYLHILGCVQNFKAERVTTFDIATRHPATTFFFPFSQHPDRSREKVR